MQTKENIMNEYELNNNQAEVVANESKELIVQAGAGSGKTKTLVCKVVNLLKKAKDLDNFLVLTFTKKAALEMKDRIKSMLLEIGLTNLVNKIDSSNISTFDAFAYNFVKQNSNLIGLDSNIEILDGTSLKIVTKEILNEVILNVMNNKEGYNKLYNFLELYTDNNSENDLIDKLLEIFGKISELGKISEIEKEKLIKRKGLFDDKFFENSISKIDEIVPRFSDMNSDNLCKITEYLNYLNGDLISKPKLENLANIKWKDMGIDSKSVQGNRIGKLYEPFKKLYSLDIDKKDINEYFEIEEEHLTNILVILSLYEEKLLEFKKKTNKYEFKDIARFLNQILIENPKVLERQKEIFKYVFVDEYQDTSEIQSQFLNLLIDNNKDIKVLYVGDIKQCIYKFRDAKPETFRNKLTQVENIFLNINYRSAKGIVSFTNKLFKNILDDKEKYDIDYSENHSMQSCHGAVEDDLKANVYIEECFRKKELKDGKFDSVEEAFTVGEKIKELKKNAVIKDYSEVTILARNKTVFGIYEKVFNFLEIPLQTLVDQKLKQTYLLKLIANILKLSLIINNDTGMAKKEKRFYYYSIAKSELYERSDYNLFNDLIDSNNFTQKLEIDDDILLKCKLLNGYIKTRSNYEIIDKTIELFNVFNKITKAVKQKEKEYQIEYLYELASSLDGLDKVGEDFVEYIYSFSYKDEIKPEISIMQHNDDSVKLTNIHQAKGLEYDVLFLVDLNKEFRKLKLKKFYYDNDNKFLIDLKRCEKNAKIDAIIDYQKVFKSDLIFKDSIKEELRLLYVAITRAKESLYIVTTPKEDYSKLNSFTDYLYKNDLRELVAKENIKVHRDSLKNETYYQKNKDLNLYYPKDLDDLENKDFNIKTEIKEESRASNYISKLISDEEKAKLSIGAKMHLDFEYRNLKNPLVEKFYETKFGGKNLSEAKLLFEYEFSYEEENKQVKGIIDLIAIYENEVHIIDYKLKDIDIEKYTEQLVTYKTYLSKIFDLNIKLYLYSILDGKVNHIE